MPDKTNNRAKDDHDADGDQVGHQGDDDPDRAGLSKPTVFGAVGSKQAVLAAVRDVALAGDDLPVAIAERAPFQAVLAEPDPYLMADHLADLWDRYALIREVLRGATSSSGEPALREL